MHIFVNCSFILVCVCVCVCVCVRDGISSVKCPNAPSTVARWIEGAVWSAMASLLAARRAPVEAGAEVAIATVLPNVALPRMAAICC